MCPHCDHLLAGNDRGLCGPCWACVVPLAGAVCPRCGSPTDTPSEPCLACSENSPAQHATVVWGEHDGVLRTAILALKHGGRDDLATPLGLRLAAKITAEPWAAAIDGVVPVPSHPWRRLRRPWAASELLARVIGRRLGKPVTRALRRRGLGRQTGRTRARRLELPRRSFTIRSAVGGRKLLLVDDVTTTGATLRRAAEALHDSGADSVYCCAMALAPDSRRFS
jgi:predicted amidophosphoribosyltransferase